MRADARSVLVRSVSGALLLPLALASCSSRDYTDLARYYDHEPATILVLPILNETTDAEAARFFLSTIARPLVMRGYYVLPIESTMAVFAREGIYDAGVAWQVEPGLLHEHLGADAALFVTIESWDTSYIVLSSSVTVAMRYRLVDCRTGNVLWETAQSHTESSGTYVGGGGLAGLVAGLAVSAIDAATTAALTDYVPLASAANTKALASLPPGRYHPDHERLRREIDAWRDAQPAASGSSVAGAP